MIKIRKATLKDVPALVELNAMLEDGQDEIILKNMPWLEPLSKRKNIYAKETGKGFRKTINSKERFMFLAEINGKLAGYLEGAVRKHKVRHCISGSIWDIFIKKEFRGKGISSKLKKEALKIMRKKHAVYVSLNVNRYNTRAHSIYKKWGFVDSDISMLKKL